MPAIRYTCLLHCTVRLLLGKHVPLHNCTIHLHFARVRLIVLKPSPLSPWHLFGALTLYPVPSKSEVSQRSWCLALVRACPQSLGPS